MKCGKPLVINGSAFGCGQCTPCRINRRRVWTHRIMLEAAQYADNCFVTLSYNNEKLPEDMSVDPRILSGWIKRLRSRTPRQIRYFGCGEYGDASFRPHYHVALFGYPRCRKGISYFRDGNCCATCNNIDASWQNGNILVGDLTTQSASYIAGYVVKKMTTNDDPRLEGRKPEFARMSLRPALGVGMMDEIASVILMGDHEQRMIDVPNSLRHGSKMMPLGRFLRRKLRERIGRKPNEPLEAKLLRESELSNVQKAAFDNSQSFAVAIREKFKGKTARAEALELIYKPKRKI